MTKVYISQLDVRCSSGKQWKLTQTFEKFEQIDNFEEKRWCFKNHNYCTGVRRARRITGTSFSPVSEKFSEQNHREASEFTNPEQELFHPSALLADIITAGNERLPASAEASFTGWLLSYLKKIYTNTSKTDLLSTHTNPVTIWLLNHHICA